MIAELDTPLMSPQEYLTWEAEEPLRYGYMNGQVYAMTGGTIPHNQVAVNLVALIKPHLRGKQCKTLSSNAKIGVTEQGPFHYPDVSVTCDQRDRTAREYISYPCLIVEVLSGTTEAFDEVAAAPGACIRENCDRGKKFSHYRRIETLREYVLIDPDSYSVECYRLNEHHRWELFHYTCEAENSEAYQIELASINLKFPMQLLYEDIEIIGKSASRQ